MPKDQPKPKPGGRRRIYKRGRRTRRPDAAAGRTEVRGARRLSGAGGLGAAVGGMMARQRAAGSTETAFKAKQAAPDPAGGRKRELPRENVTVRRADRMALWFGVMFLAGVFALQGCTVPQPEAGQVTRIILDSSPVLDQEAARLEAAGDLERAARFREWAGILLEIGSKVEAAISDGVIDENDAFENIAPLLTLEEQDVLVAALTVAGQIGRGEPATPDSVLAAVQSGLPIFLPGYGVLIAGLLGVIRAVLVQRKNTDAIVAGVDTMMANTQVSADSMFSTRAAMGARARRAVRASKARNEVRGTKFRVKANASMRERGTAAV